MKDNTKQITKTMATETASKTGKEMSTRSVTKNLTSTRDTCLPKAKSSRTGCVPDKNRQRPTGKKKPKGKNSATSASHGCIKKPRPVSTRPPLPRQPVWIQQHFASGVFFVYVICFCFHSTLAVIS